MLTSNQPSFGSALGHDLAAIADQPIHQRDVGAVGFALQVIRLRHVARHENMRFDAGRGRIGGERAGGVSGRGDRHLLDAQFDAHRDGAGEPARLERGGGVQAFVLHPERFGAHARAQTLRADERRPAFAQRDDGTLGGGQNRRVSPHGGRAVRDIAPPPAHADGIEIVADQQRSAAAAQILHGSGLEPLLTQAAFQMRSFRHGNTSLAPAISRNGNALDCGGMLTDEELTGLLTDLESDRVERKQSLSDRDEDS